MNSDEKTRGHTVAICKGLLTVALIGIAIMTGMASAAVITPTVHDYSSSLTDLGWGIPRDAAFCVDGSGLTGDGSAGSTHAVGDTGIAWTTVGYYTGGTVVAPDYDPYITFDLGGLYDVDTIREWGCTSLYNYFGPDEVDVYTSADDVTYTLAETVNFALAPATPYAGNDIAVNYAGVRYIKLDIMTSQEGEVFDGTATVEGTIDGRHIAQLSEIRFEGTLVGADPANKASGPNPANNATFVPVARILSWTGPTNYTASGYDVYFGTDRALVEAGSPSVRVSTNQPGTSYDPVLSHDAEYFWRVDAYDGGAVYEGDIWSFTTSVEPPETMRVTVDKDGETRTFNLDKYSIRGPDFELVLLGTDGVTQTTIDAGPVRNYRGWCEEEADSYVEATLLPNGDLRYMVFKGHDYLDWSYYPALVYNENAEPENNFTEIGGAPVQPSGTKRVDASWTDPAVVLTDTWGSDIWTTTYQADVGFDLLVEYVNAFNYADWETYGRKAENAISHYNAMYIRDGLLENQLGKVVIRQSQEGLHYTNAQWGVEWPSINYYWNILFPSVDHQFVGMVGSVGGGVAFGCEYAGLGWAARSFNGWSGGGDFWHVARHEMGHNNGAGDCVGGCPGPDGATVMSGNATSLNRFSTLEIDSWMGCRSGRTSVLRELGDYSYPVPPYAKYDDPGAISVDGGAFIDVLGNDYDANGDQVAISSFDTDTELGGMVVFSAGSHPDGRDELVYFPPATAGVDSFTYRITDPTGRIGQGNVVVTVTNELIASPEDDITFAGAVRGPSFNLTSDTDTLTLSNVSTASLDWTASKTQDWLSLSLVSGTIASGNTADVIITINAAADLLEAGKYTATVTITDTTNATTTQRDVVLTVDARDAKLYWPMEEAGGSDVFDASGYDNDGTLTNMDPNSSAVPNSDWVDGKYGGGLEFDGIDDTVDGPLDLHLTGSVTISAWLNFDASGSNTFRRAVSKGYYGDGWQLGLTQAITGTYVANGGEFSLKEDTGTVRTIGGTSSLTAGTWNHLVGVYDIDTDTMYLYVNGNLENSLSISPSSAGIMQNWAPFRAGASTGDGLYYPGLVDEVRYYNYAVDQAEIDALYAGGRAENPDPIDMAEGVSIDKDLSWAGGASAVEHDVYIGTDYDAVLSATTESDEYMGRQSEIVYDPNLNLSSRYYWRIDEVDAGGTIIAGNLWEFTTGTLITPTVYDFSSQNPVGYARYASYTVDGSGLTGDGSSGSTHLQGDDGISWTTAGIYDATDYDPYITYDLGDIYDVVAIREWGSNSSIGSIFGPDEVDIYTSTDGVVFTLATTVNFALAPGVSGYAGNDIAVNLSDVRYIKLDFISNHDGAVFDGTSSNGGDDGRSLCQLHEIRFEGKADTYDGTDGIADLVGFAGHWLDKDCVDMPACGGADLDDDQDVDMHDLAVFASNWMLGS